MKTFAIACLFFLSVSICAAQEVLYKGLKKGMSKEEAKTELRNHPEKYQKIDFENSTFWSIYERDLVFSQHQLMAVMMKPHDMEYGLNYTDTYKYLIHTRSFFKDLDYAVLAENQYWSRPQNFVKLDKDYAVLFQNPGKNLIVNMSVTTIRGRYMPYLMLFSAQDLSRFIEQDLPSKNKTGF
ncbi:MAG: hypothetical protein ACQESK_05195 [Bacteroidota bacterium]